MKKKIDPATILVFGGLVVECIGFAGCFILKRVYNHISKKEEN